MKKILSLLLVFCIGTAFGYCIFSVQSNAAQKSNDHENIIETKSTEFSAGTEFYEVPLSSEISDFPYTLQTPELPTGCEITSLTMVLNYYGYSVDKTTMATVYLPTVPADMYYDEFGIMHGEDLNDYFIGDPESAYGYVCGTNAIVTAANDYLSDANSSLTAKDITGYSPDKLYGLVSLDIPIVVWITIDMMERSETYGWYTDNGSYVEWSQSDHCGVLVGYTDDTVIIADPLNGRTEYSKSDFESVYISRGCQGVILE
ncbi:MAG: C39 family peptidase [Ruminococcus sp.]